MKFKGFATGVWVFGACPDRFCTGGYKKSSTLEESLDQIAAVEDLTGVMIHYPAPLNFQNADYIRKELEKRGLKVASCDVDLFGDPFFAKGSLISEKKEVREKAIQLAKDTMDIAEEMGSEIMNLWPGQDGFDYPFQIDYRAQWDLLVDALQEIAAHNPRVKLSLEYKLREPRTHSTISTSGVALFLSLTANVPNIGVTIDFGHALNCKESPGNVVAMLDKYGKLFALHLNDNFRDWDDDMAVGTVHLIETLEFFYYLNNSQYTGWLGLDIFPYREDPALACQVSIENIKYLLQIVEKIDVSKLRELQKEANALEILRYMRELL